MQLRPFVFVNMAMTADGKIDTVARSGARISGRADSARVDRLRAGSDAIMVGGHTLISEDPRLTVRDAHLVRERTRVGKDAQPMKVGVVSKVDDRGQRTIDPDGAFLHDGGGRVLVCTSGRTSKNAIGALEAQGAKVIVAGDDRVDLPASLRAIAGLGVERLMVEGGSTLVAALLEAGLVDELQLAVAPLLFGGSGAPTPVGGDGWPRESAIDLRLVECSTSSDDDVVLRYRLGRGRGAMTDITETIAALPPTPVDGLTDGEAAKRREQGLGNSAPPATTRTYLAIVRENVFTFINNVLFVMGALLVIVGRPFDAFVSLMVIGTNIVVGIYQEIRAKQALDEIALLTRPTATVVRDGSVRSVGPEEIVVGDLIEVGAGDQIVVDGELAEGRVEVDESQLTGESDMVPKRVGDEVFSGSYPTSGRGRYLAQTVGEASLAGRITAGAKTFRRTLTPLQRQIQTVIRVTLGVVLYLQLLLIVKNVVDDTPLDEAIVEATVLIGLVPNGLFVSIAIAYALAAVHMSQFGALVQQANAVESLSHVDTLCVDKTGTLTANRLELDQILPLEGDEASARRRVGLMVASGRATNKTSEAVAEGVQATSRPPLMEVPFSSKRKWSAVALPAGVSPDHPRAGVYSMGAPTFLRRYLDISEAQWRNIQALVAHHTSRGMRVLLAAYSPSLELEDEGDASVLPKDSKPYAIVVLRDLLRPEAAETLTRFREMGVDVRVISGDDPETVATLAHQAGLDTSGGVVSGAELESMDEPHFEAAVEVTTVFGRVSPELKERLVGTLRDQGRYVAMTGDGVNDVLSLKRSNLAIAMGSGTQAARGVADLILIDDGFSALASAIGEGQRILNGMQDILRVFLTRILTLGMLILVLMTSGFFPVDLRNASAITLFTVGIPTALLAIWSRPGPFLGESLLRTLAKFVLPAAGLASVIGLLVVTGVFFVGNADFEAGLVTEEMVENSAKTSVTVFLILVGMLVVVFVEPPVKLLAVIEPLSPDLRPTWLALGLTSALGIVLLVPPFRDFFSLYPLSIRDLGIILGGVLAWAVLVWIFWRWRFVERFLGSDVKA